MTLFHIVNDAHVILRSKGVYKQAKVYTYDGHLYAGWGSGFIGLRREGGTTKPDMLWIDSEGFKYSVSKLGKLKFQGVRT